MTNEANEEKLEKEFWNLLFFRLNQKGIDSLPLVMRADINDFIDEKTPEGGIPYIKNMGKVCDEVVAELSKLNRQAEQGSGQQPEADLAIKFNNIHAPTECALCDNVIDPEVGYCLFLRDSMELVCSECGLTLTPELAAMLGIKSGEEDRAFDSDNIPF